VLRESARSGRLTPLTGVLFVVLVLVGGPLLERSTPGASSAGAHVVAFYSAHRGRERAAAIVLALSFAAFLFFAAVLRARWRRTQEGLAGALLAAATVVVVGESVSDGVGYALTNAPSRLTPSSAQTLNLLSNDLVLTSAIGFLAFGIVAGLAILRGVGLPRWLGWAAIVIGVLFVVPPLEFAGFFLLLVWIAIVAVRGFRDQAIV